MRRFRFFLFFGAVFLVWAGSASAARLYLDPSTLERDTGETFDVGVMLDTEGQTIGGVSAFLQYDPTRAECRVVQLDEDAAAQRDFSASVPDRENCTGGLIKIHRVRTGAGISGAAVRVGTLRLTGRQVGELVLENFQGSIVTLASNPAVNLFSGGTAGRYRITQDGDEERRFNSSQPALWRTFRGWGWGNVDMREIVIGETLQSQPVGVGWIRLSNETPDRDGRTDGGPSYGVGIVSCTRSDQSTAVPCSGPGAAFGILGGFAWSGISCPTGADPARTCGYGWLSFEAEDLSSPQVGPDAFICAATEGNFGCRTVVKLSTGEIFGWARFLGPDPAGANLVTGHEGWDGFVRLRGRIGRDQTLLFSPQSVCGGGWGPIARWVAELAGGCPGADYGVCYGNVTQPDGKVCAGDGARVETGNMLNGWAWGGDIAGAIYFGDILPAPTLSLVRTPVFNETNNRWESKVVAGWTNANEYDFVTITRRKNGTGPAETVTARNVRGATATEIVEDLNLPLLTTRDAPPGQGGDLFRYAYTIRYGRNASGALQTRMESVFEKTIVCEVRPGGVHILRERPISNELAPGGTAAFKVIGVEYTDPVSCRVEEEGGRIAYPISWIREASVAGVTNGGQLGTIGAATGEYAAPAAIIERTGVTIKGASLENGIFDASEVMLVPPACVGPSCVIEPPSSCAVERVEVRVNGQEAVRVPAGGSAELTATPVLSDGCDAAERAQFAAAEKIYRWEIFGDAGGTRPGFGTFPGGTRQRSGAEAAVMYEAPVTWPGGITVPEISEFVRATLTYTGAGVGGEKGGNTARIDVFQENVTVGGASCTITDDAAQLQFSWRDTISRPHQFAIRRTAPTLRDIIAPRTQAIESGVAVDRNVEAGQRYSYQILVDGVSRADIADVSCVRLSAAPELRSVIPFVKQAGGAVARWFHVTWEDKAANATNFIVERLKATPREAETLRVVNRAAPVVTLAWENPTTRTPFRQWVERGRGNDPFGAGISGSARLAGEETGPANVARSYQLELDSVATLQNASTYYYRVKTCSIIGGTSPAASYFKNLVPKDDGNRTYTDETRPALVAKIPGAPLCAYSDAVSFTTPPAAPGTPNVRAEEPFALRVSWAVDPEARGYVLERRVSGAGTWSNVFLPFDVQSLPGACTRTGNTISCRDTGLQTDTIYEYRAKAYVYDVEERRDDQVISAASGMGSGRTYFKVTVLTDGAAGTFTIDAGAAGCGANCTLFSKTVSPVIRAIPAANSEFSLWTICRQRPQVSCSDTAVNPIQVNEDVEVTAHFRPKQTHLVQAGFSWDPTIQKASARVTGNGMNCLGSKDGADLSSTGVCSLSFQVAPGPLTFSATDGSITDPVGRNAQFAWGGDCEAAAGECRITVQGTKTVMLNVGLEPIVGRRPAALLASLLQTMRYDVRGFFATLKQTPYFIRGLGMNFLELEGYNAMRAAQVTAVPQTAAVTDQIVPLFRAFRERVAEWLRAPRLEAAEEYDAFFEVVRQMGTDPALDDRDQERIRKDDVYIYRVKAQTAQGESEWSEWGVGAGADIAIAADETVTGPGGGGPGGGGGGGGADLEVAIWANPTDIFEGERTEVSWRASNADVDSVRVQRTLASGGSATEIGRGQSGAVSDTPASSARYEVSATSQNGAVTEVASVAVTVRSRNCVGPCVPPPPPPPTVQCGDGADNDGDGKIDYPADPGCSSINDDNESDTSVCTGPNPPSSCFQTAGSCVRNNYCEASMVLVPPGGTNPSQCEENRDCANVGRFQRTIREQ